MNPVDRIELPAPAKLTVELHITGVRPDGYHSIDAEMVSLDLHDLVTIDALGDGLTASGPYAAGMPLDHRNLVHRALQLVGRRAAVHIDKRIPHGGGLGGGSADAAAILRWAGFDDTASAATIGADVPFCLIGGRARVTGIGEIVDPLAHIERHYTLVIPPFGVSTPAVYREWDRLGGPTDHDRNDRNDRNDLEVAAISVEPRLAVWRDHIGDLCGVAPTLAGSGSTWFVDGQRVDALAGLVDEGAQIVPAMTRPA